MKRSLTHFGIAVLALSTTGLPVHGAVLTPPPLSIDPSLNSASALLLDSDNDNAGDQQTGRYFFDLLDHASSYGKDFFADPIAQGPNLDIDNSVSINHVIGRKHHHTQEQIEGEFQWNPVGKLSIDITGGWVSGQAPGEDGSSRGASSGWENIDIGIYHPIFQYVSPDKFFDYTALFRLDIGVPTRTRLSRTDSAVTPFLGNLLRLGQHISIETWTGPSFALGPHTGDNSLIYGATLGYVLQHDDFPLPLIERCTPLLELDGQTAFSPNHGADALFGLLGVSLDFQTHGILQPKLDLGIQFPLDQGAHNQSNWTAITNISFGF